MKSWIFLNTFCSLLKIPMTPPTPTPPTPPPPNVQEIVEGLKYLAPSDLCHQDTGTLQTLEQQCVQIGALCRLYLNDRRSQP